MNRRGQTLLIFLIILPIFLGFMAIIVDVSFIQLNQKKLNQVTEMLLSDYYVYRTDSEIFDYVENGFVNNQIESTNLEVFGTEDDLKIVNRISVSSIFGNIIGIRNYDVSVSLKIIMKDGKKEYIKE